VPKDAAELAEAVHARDLRIFFGAYSRDRKPVGLAERFMSLMPAMEGVPEGDFRDWPDIEAWASGIAEELAQATPAGP
jgi:menaquinone-dependent protoporphyrinogen oxidase